MSNTTKHNHELVFGRRVAGCPRCAELNAGAPAVKGWGSARKEADRMHCEAIRRHVCSRERCGIVCTFGQW